MTGYVRQDTSNNIADGNVINSADLDAEFDGVQAAFNASTGHVHDGTTGNGAPILVVGPTQDIVVSATAVTPKTTNTVDIGSSSLKFKDIYITGSATLPTVSATTIGATTGNITTVNATTVDTTNIEVTTLKAKDGTAAGSIADSTGVVTLASSILTTADINGGTLDNVVIGGTTAAAASVTTLTTSSTVTHNGGTANGVAYLNGSKVVTTGSALTFDGTLNFSIGTASTFNPAAGRGNITLNGSSASLIEMGVGSVRKAYIFTDGTDLSIANDGTGAERFILNGSEQMRLTSTGLGIGTSSPGAKLDVNGEVRSRTTAGFVINDGSELGAFKYSGGLVINRVSGSSLFFQLNGSSQATLDSSGNLGLGVTPSAWAGNYRALQVGPSNPGAIWSGSYDVNIGSNIYQDGAGTYKQIGASYRGALYKQFDSAHIWYTTSNAGANTSVTPTQAMTLDANGNLGIGTSSPQASAKLHVFATGDYTDESAPFTLGSSAVGGVRLYSGVNNTNEYSYIGSVKSGTRYTSLVLQPNGGNLGLGVTPRSGWNSGFKAMEFSGGYGAISGQTAGAGVFGFSWGAYATGAGTWAYSTTGDIPNLFTMNSGLFKWFIAPSGTAGNAISFTQAMTLDASGRLLVGGTASGSDSYITANDGICILNKSTNVSSLYFGVYGTPTDSYSYIRADARASGYLAFSTNNTERARIDSSGNLLVGTTDNSITSGPGVKIAPNIGAATVSTLSTNSNSCSHVYSTGAGAYRFYVGWGGTVYATSTSISAISDATLKENVRDLETGLTEVMALRPRRFDWKNGDAQNVAGFVAQEVEQVLPELVTDYQYSEGVTKKSLKMGDILPTLVNAIQEQQAIINQLKARLDAANL